MFLVSDNVIERKKRIEEFLAIEPTAAVLLAAAHFEWCVRRTIIALGCSPNVTIRKRLERAYGLDALKDIWRDELCVRLPRVKTSKAIKNLPNEVKNWSDFRKAFELRHRLIHGVSSCGASYAETRAKRILQAAEDVIAVCTRQGWDINSRIPIRIQNCRE